MPDTRPRPFIEIEYENAAQEYLRSLPLEHFMESTPQATQRKISIVSLDLVQVERPDVQTFSELLVQYKRRKSRAIERVVPDNMVVVHPEAIKAKTSFNMELQPVGPFWVLEYVSKESQRKDYEENFQKYEKDLKVPYYLVFYPDNQELTLYQLRRRQYRAVHPNEEGRNPIPELDLELGLLDGWVRFWFRGRLLPLPAELQRELNEIRRLLDQERKRADRESKRADQEHQARVALEEELARLRAQLGQKE